MSIRAFLISTVFASTFYGCGVDYSPIVEENTLNEVWYEYRFIAHGGGNIEGIESSNTIETFCESYARGFKVQEIDVMYTTDSICVLHRGWWDLEETLNLDHKPNYNDFMRSLYLGKYHTCDLLSIVDFMKTHKDTYILVDGSHEIDPTLYVETILEYSNLDKSILDRFIFEVSTDRVYEIIDSIGHFDKYMYAGVDYRKIDIDDNIQFCKAHGISAVSTGSIALTKEVIQKYNNNGIKVFAYSINDEDEVKALYSDGVWGFYTDLLTPAVLQNIIEGR